MYTILITSDNQLLTSVKERIMQRSKLVDKLHFLTSQMYNDEDMSDYQATMEYILPVSKEYRVDYLIKSNNLYKNEYLEYKIPIDTNLTKEPGNIEIQITFSKSEMNSDGEVIQHIRKINPGYIEVIPVAAWSNAFPDDALSALDQRIIMLQNIANELDDLQQSNIQEIEKKADDFKLDIEDGSLYLTSNGKKIGNPITLNSLGDALSENTEDGLTYVITDDETTDNPEETSQYTLKLDLQKNEIHLLSHGVVVSTITAQDLAESIVQSTKEDGLNEVIV